MAIGMARYGVGAALMALVIAAPATAAAHAYVIDPPPRDVANPDLDARAHKTGPCGGVPRTGAPKKYTPGQTITVRWEETISHTGCFQIGFSAANDANFTVLKQKPDPAGGAGTIYMDTVTLPTTPCPACTLVVRQIMDGNPCVEPPAANPPANTYFSCADICIGNAGDPCTVASDGGAGDGGSSSSSSSSGGSSSGGSSSGGPTTTPTDGGGKTTDPGTSSGTSPNLRSGAGDDGCNVTTGGGGSATALGVLAGFFGLALARRRRARR